MWRLVDFRSMWLIAAFWVVTASAGGSQASDVFETDVWPVPENGVDVRILAALRAHKLEPAKPCSDQVFVRRVYLDVIGTLPTPAEVQAFLSDSRMDKRARLIDVLLRREEFADYWALKWGDILRVKAEFPSNLWPNAVQAYHRWIRDAIRQNRPYDQFVRELLTSSGSNFRVPPVNFYRAVQNREPAGLAEAVALTFMGTRIATWPPERRDAMATFFSRVAYKKTGEWKEEIVYCDFGRAEPLEVMFPDGTRGTIAADQDPREAFADWLIASENPWFARNIVNRIWAWLFGRGIVHEPDDHRPDNPPIVPELLSYLEQELVKARYDLKHIYRLILNSRTYQQSPIPRCDPGKAEAYFACYPVRRLDAEVLIDALNWIGGTSETYFSPIPEPFTYIPEEKRSIELADASITSVFLEMFGRPPRDTGLESERNNHPSDAQCLYLLNSTDVYRRITRSPHLKRIMSVAENPTEMVRGIYRTILSREPTPNELATAEAYFDKSGLELGDCVTDLAWALVNSMEFLYRH